MIKRNKKGGTDEKNSEETFEEKETTWSLYSQHKRSLIRVFWNIKVNCVNGFHYVGHENEMYDGCTVTETMKIKT